MYIYEQKDWPNFIWEDEGLMEVLGEVRYLQGRLLGRMGSLGFEVCEEASFRILTEDVIKTSEIEGEKLNQEMVRSSIARRLGIDIGISSVIDRKVEGIVEVMLDAVNSFDNPLTKERLFGWQAALFPTGYSGIHAINVGKWRDEGSGMMQVKSGPIGRETVHYEAPSYDKLDFEMERFLFWVNDFSEMDLVIKSAIAHFWFVTIHPFDDGNGRIARAIADMLLARCERSKQRFYSMSSQIQKERKGYYEVLERCQKGSLDISAWIRWYLLNLRDAILASDRVFESILVKVRFWEVHAKENFNERQRLLINRLLDGLYGKLTSSKWAKIAKCSQDTALRDIQYLLERKILKRDISGGRSTSYSLVLPDV